jgi:hypothetical protein
VPRYCRNLAGLQRNLIYMAGLLGSFNSELISMHTENNLFEAAEL